MAPLAEHTSDNEKDDTLGNIEDLWDEPKGRRPDVCKTLLQGDEQSIMLLGKLGLIEGMDNKPKGLEALSPQRAEYTPNPAHWDFDCMEEIKADPFIWAAIENACQSLDQTNVSAEDLTSRLDATLNESLRLVVTPLKNVISKTETTQSILQELAVLRLYFHDFNMPLEVDWGSPLDNSNELLEQIRWFDITALADAISRKDHALFSEYVVASFTEYGQQARWILNTRWDRLRKTVKRLMIAGIGLSSRIDDLAKSLHLCHNYYSLTAVIQGVKASGFMTEALSEFGELIDPSNNYQYYQHGMLKDAQITFVKDSNALTLFPEKHNQSLDTGGTTVVHVGVAHTAGP
ncbi:hypothetical protein N7530_009789 [Penicillium desertorum]|uniref:Uncharacterized protein n=1 Tax=Penicillium desertorum TaxID=1303715 RepID=A0A9X0BIK7_9EURO|nr:hypothetical protein N7530_009789 [Penicillium desertorum]